MGGEQAAYCVNYQEVNYSFTRMPCSLARPHGGPPSFFFQLMLHAEKMAWGRARLHAVQ